MPRPKSTPTYCVHKRSGRAYTTIDGRQHPLGKANTPESLAAYDRLIGQWFSNGRRLPPDALRDTDAKPTGPTCSMLIEAFWHHALSYYTTPARDGHGNPITNPDGTPQLVPSKELDCYRQALRPLMRMYGSTPTAQFGCAELEALRAAMIRPRTGPQTGQTEPGWCRAYANRRVGRIKHAFGWGVTRNLLPASVHHALMQVKGLRAGRSPAREPEPVGPVDEARALAIIPHVSAQVGEMIKVQLHTGMRSTELCIMRPQDIDRTVTPWVYRPIFHKTQYRGIAREIPIGPKARDVLAPYLEGRNPDSFIFSPAEAEQERHRRQREKREYVPSARARGLRPRGTRATLALAGRPV